MLFSSNTYDVRSLHEIGCFMIKCLGVLLTLVLLMPATSVMVFSLASTENVDEQDFGLALEGSPHNRIVSKGVFYRNMGQIDNEEVEFFGRIQDRFVGFCRSQILIMNSRGDITNLYKFNSSLDFEIHGSEFQYLTHCFLGSRGTFLDIKSYSSILYSEYSSDIKLISSYYNSGILLEVLSSDSPVEVSTSEHRSLLIEGQYLDLDNIENNEDTESIHSYGLAQTQQTPSYQFRSSLINPLLFSTYFGGTGYDQAISIDLDEEENIYIGGRAEPVIPFDYEIGSPGSTDDLVVMKLSKLGNGVEWISYIGGTDYDRGSMVYFNDSIYVAGVTKSTDFPVKNPFQSNKSVGYDAFLLRLSSSGNELYFSSYLGGDKREDYINIEIDPQGSLIIAGHTGSNDFPVLNGFDMIKNPYDEHYINREVFVAKFNSSGALQFSTFLRGSDTGSSLVGGLVTDEVGDIFVTGSTQESDFPCTEGCYFGSSESRPATFVAKIKANGSALIWSALYGSINCAGTDLALMPDGSVCVIGGTHGGSIPLVSPFDDVFNRNNPIDDSFESFIFRLSSTGDQLLYSSYLGGDELDSANAIYVDSTGYVYVTGSTKSDDFPRTFPYSLQPVIGRSIFLLKFDWNLQRLHFSLILPSSPSEPKDVHVDSAGRVYLTGYTWSNYLPLVNPIQDHYSEGGPDWFISIWRDLTDRDFDGLDDIEEEAVGTGIYNNDSDFDYTSDGWETYYGLDPLNQSDALDDLDSDTLFNLDEYLLGTDPSNPDSDFDNHTDAWEVANGYDPMDPLSPTRDDLDQFPALVIVSSVALVSVVILFMGREKIGALIHKYKS